ncbi:C-GCAxxG-C-C family protein [Desulfocurvus sp. DL9XJH121]
MAMNGKGSAAANLAGNLFGAGYHCAEAVARAVLETLGQDSAEAVAHATAFGGGFGNSSQEACGALSGAFIVIGHLYRRPEPGASWERPAALGAGLRDWFLAEHGTTNCAALCKGFGEKDQMGECRRIVCATARALTAELEEAPGEAVERGGAA